VSHPPGMMHAWRLDGSKPPPRRLGIEYDHRLPLFEGGPISLTNLPARCTTSCHPDETAADRKRQ
jgi:hypothetical protein